MKDLRELVVQYLEEQKLMQLCTVGQGGQPWACNVWQASDADLNIYFFSAVNRRHSLEIENDARVAGALALPHKPSDKYARGLQFEGIVKKLVDPEEVKAAH